jgi:hypothetical protein
MKCRHGDWPLTWSAVEVTLKSTPQEAGDLARALWFAFAISLIAVAVLVVRDLHRGPRVRLIAIARPGSALAPGPTARWPASNAVGSPRTSDPTPDAKEPSSSPAPGADPADPVAFGERLLDLLRQGDIDGILARGEPGFIRAVAPDLGNLWNGKPEDFAAAADNIGIELEEIPGGRFRIRMSLAGESYSGKDLFLVPHEGSWRMAAADDLPGPVADRQRTIERLRLLGLGQQAYLSEGLGGASPRFAGSAFELREGLESTPAFAGLIDPALVGAADEGRPLGGYLYGRAPGGTGRFAYIASPVAMGPGSLETFAVDTDGKMWSRELGAEPAPAEWPADPESAGWKRVEGQWPSL